MVFSFNCLLTRPYIMVVWVGLVLNHEIARDWCHSLGSTSGQCLSSPSFRGSENRSRQTTTKISAKWLHVYIMYTIPSNFCLKVMVNVSYMKQMVGNAKLFYENKIPENKFRISESKNPLNALKGC